MVTFEKVSADEVSQKPKWHELIKEVDSLDESEALKLGGDIKRSTVNIIRAQICQHLGAGKYSVRKSDGVYYVTHMDK